MRPCPQTNWNDCTAELARTPSIRLQALQLSAALRHYPHVTNEANVVRRMNLLLLGSFLNNWN